MVLEADWEKAAATTRPEGTVPSSSPTASGPKCQSFAGVPSTTPARHPRVPPTSSPGLLSFDRSSKGELREEQLTGVANVGCGHRGCIPPPHSLSTRPTLAIFI